LKISYSRYSAYCFNPELFRLKYMLGLTPEGDDTPNLFNFGRRRGRCFHEIYEGKDREQLIREYGLAMVERAELMRAVVPDLGEMDWIERSFEIPIFDGKHSITGRIDHRFHDEGAGVRHPGDFKTTKGTRTKKELGEYLQGLEDSTQHHFYLRAEREFAEPTGLFTYHVIFDRKDKDHKPTYTPVHIPYLGPAEIDRTMSCVYAACVVIEALKEYGIEKPWPDTRKWGLDDIYKSISGRLLPKGAVPDGFTSRFKEQIEAEAESE
jgi:hypothetical protein